MSEYSPAPGAIAPPPRGALPPSRFALPPSRLRRFGGTSRRTSRRASLRWAGIISVLCLALLWATYYLTNEPSTAVKVQWREGLSAERRAEVERRYLLVYQEDTPDGWTRYDLLDTRRSNIAALVGDPGVAETIDIDRDTMTVPFHAEYGKQWVWAAHRTPGLRDARVRRVVIGGLAAVALLAALVELRRRPGAA